MKKCHKCSTKYTDEFEFCTICGAYLKKVSLNDVKERFLSNKTGVIAIIILIVATSGIGMTLLEKKKMNDARKAIEEYKYEKAIAEYKATPITSDLKINSDWTQEKRGGYIYIKGSVTNVSRSKTISYFKVEAKFYDNKGKMIDSDWTNDATDLEPSETRKFEIMYKYDTNIYDIGLSVKEVS